MTLSLLRRCAETLIGTQMTQIKQMDADLFSCK